MRQQINQDCFSDDLSLLGLGGKPGARQAAAPAADAAANGASPAARQPASASAPAASNAGAGAARPGGAQVKAPPPQGAAAPGKKGGGNQLASMWSKAPASKPKQAPASAPAAGGGGREASAKAAAVGGKGKGQGKGKGPGAAGGKPAAQHAVDADAALRLQQVQLDSAALCAGAVFDKHVHRFQCLARVSCRTFDQVTMLLRCCTQE